MSKKKKFSRNQTLEMVNSFFRKAHEAFKENKALADEYVHKARRLAMKVKLRMPSELKRRFCKYCDSYLVPGQNLRVRTQKGKLVYFCLECKHHWRMPYLKEKRANERISLLSDKLRKVYI